MLFNSTIFIMVFLPIALAGWYLLQRLNNPVYARIFLTGMSLWFYGYYNPSYLWILIVSLFMNFFISALLQKCEVSGCEFPYKSRVMATSEPLKNLKAPYMVRNPVKWGFFRLKRQEIPLKYK